MTRHAPSAAEPHAARARRHTTARTCHCLRASLGTPPSTSAAAAAATRSTAARIVAVVSDGGRRREASSSSRRPEVARWPGDSSGRKTGNAKDAPERRAQRRAGGCRRWVWGSDVRGRGLVDTVVELAPPRARVRVAAVHVALALVANVWYRTVFATNFGVQQRSNVHRDTHRRTAYNASATSTGRTRHSVGTYRGNASVPRCCQWCNSLCTDCVQQHAARCQQRPTVTTTQLNTSQSLNVARSASTKLKAGRGQSADVRSCGGVRRRGEGRGRGPSGECITTCPARWSPAVAI